MIDKCLIHNEKEFYGKTDQSANVNMGLKAEKYRLGIKEVSSSKRYMYIHVLMFVLIRFL